MFYLTVFILSLYSQVEGLVGLVNRRRMTNGTDTLHLVQHIILTA